MNNPNNSLPSETVTRCQTTLRWLLALSILLGIFAIAVSILQIPFLPKTLQQFEHEDFASPLGFGGLIFLCLAIPSLIFAVVVYVALWRGWRSGRRLYVISFVLSIPLGLMVGPRVQSALLSTTEDAGCVLAGFILAFLYFSDLRGFYESPKSA